VVTPYDKDVAKSELLLKVLYDCRNDPFERHKYEDPIIMNDNLEKSYI